MTSTLLATIESELKWREAELALLKIQLLQDVISGDETRFRLSYRSFAAITYAHYEGFIKMVLAEALETLRRMRIKPSECIDVMQAEFFSQDLRRSVNQMSNSNLLSAISQGRAFIDTFPFPRSDRVWEISNLDVPTFNKVISAFGLSPELFLDFRHHVGRLVRLRHECAHGELLKLDASKTNRKLAHELFEMQSQITLLLHVVSIELVEHFDREGFATTSYHLSKSYVP